MPRPPGSLMLGYMILMRDGEGEGAREEKVLETLEAGLISQFCSSARSSGFEGPPSEVSANMAQKINKRTIFKIEEQTTDEL